MRATVVPHRASRVGNGVGHRRWTGAATGSRQVLGVGGVASISAQARATSESVVLLPGMVAKPLFSTVLPRSHELALANSAILAGASLCVRYWAAQIGASATTTASCAAVAASLRAVPPVTQPPHVKPMIMQAMAPPTAPQISG